EKASQQKQEHEQVDIQTFWDEGGLDTEKDDVQRAYVVFIIFQKKKVYVIECELEKKTKQTLQTIFRLAETTVMTFDMAELGNGDDEHGAPHDPEILQYLQDLVGSEDNKNTHGDTTLKDNGDVLSQTKEGKTLVRFICVFIFYLFCLLKAIVLICKYN
ncbi:hypothetical protein RFI_35196, partial [Reticulomyxa filosa]